MHDNPATSPNPYAGQSTGRIWLVFIGVLVLADVTAGIEGMMVYASLKTLIKIYGDAATVGWLISGYMLVAAAFAAIVGRLGDLYGRKRMVLVVLAVAVVGSLICAMTQNLTIMIIGRSMQGVAGSILPLSFGLAREVLPEKRVPLAIGVLYSAGAIGATSGLVMGGMLVDAGIWHSVFIISAGIASFAFLVVALVLPEGARIANPGKLDKLGGVLLVPGVAALLLAFSNLRHWGLIDPRTLGLILGGVGILAIWLRHERRHPDPLIDIRMFAQRDAMLAMGCMALCALGSAQVTQLQMLLMQQPVWTGIGLGLTATLAGLLKVPANIVGMVMSPISGHLAGQRGNRFILMWGFGFNVAAWLLLMKFNTDLWVVVALIAFGCMTGNALLGVGTYNAIIVAAPMHRTSEATGVAAVVRALFHAIGAQVAMIILAHSTVVDPAGGTHPAPVGFITAFGFIAGVSLVGVLVASRLRSPPPAPAEQDGAGSGAKEESAPHNGAVPA